LKLTNEFRTRKAATNLAKHGVSFDEALTVFADPLVASGMTIAIQFWDLGSYH
jgi:uncharacterized DUF497 family protein